MFGALLALTIAAAPMPTQASQAQAAPLLQLAQARGRAPDFSIERDQQQLREEQQQDRARQDDLLRQDQTRQMYEDQRQQLDHDGAAQPGLPSALGGGFGHPMGGDSGHFSLDSMTVMKKYPGDDFDLYGGN
jgi:hypothetical protein